MNRQASEIGGENEQIMIYLHRILCSLILFYSFVINAVNCCFLVLFFFLFYSRTKKCAFSLLIQYHQFSFQIGICLFVCLCLWFHFSIVFNSSWTRNVFSSWSERSFIGFSLFFNFYFCWKNMCRTSNVFDLLWFDQQNCCRFGFFSL